MYGIGHSWAPTLKNLIGNQQPMPDNRRATVSNQEGTTALADNYHQIFGLARYGPGIYLLKIC